VGVDIQKHQLLALLVLLVDLETALELREVGSVDEAVLEAGQVGSVAVGDSVAAVGLMEVEADLMAQGGREVLGIRVGVGSEIVGVGIRMGMGIMERRRRMPLQDQVGEDLVVVEVGMRVAEGGSEIGVGLETVVEEVGLVAGIVGSAVIGTVEEEMVGMVGDMEVIGMALAEDLVIVIGVAGMVGMVEVGIVVVAQGMIMAGRDSTMGMDIVVAEATPEGEGIRPPLSLQKTPVVCAFG